MSMRALLRRPAFLASAGVLVLVLAVWIVMASQAAQPQSLDARTLDVAAQLQCPVCNGESVANSNSAIANQMRGVIRSQLASGLSEQQVLTYFEQTYGSSILESPPKQGFTLLIWLVPALALLAGFGIVYSFGKEWQRTRVSPVAFADAASVEYPLPEMTEVENARLRAVLQRELEAEEGLPMRQRPANGLEGRV